MQNETINHACDELPFFVTFYDFKKQNELARNIYI